MAVSFSMNISLSFSQSIDVETYNEYKKQVKSIEDGIAKEKSTLKSFENKLKKDQIQLDKAKALGANYKGTAISQIERWVKSTEKDIEKIVESIAGKQAEIDFYNNKIAEFDKKIELQKEQEIKDRKMIELQNNINNKIAKLKNKYSKNVSQIDFNQSYDNLIIKDKELEELLEISEENKKIEDVQDLIVKLENRLLEIDPSFQPTKNLNSYDDYKIYSETLESRISEILSLNEIYGQIASLQGEIQRLDPSVSFDNDRKSLEDLRNYFTELKSKKYLLRISKENLPRERYFCNLLLRKQKVLVN